MSRWQKIGAAVAVVVAATIGSYGAWQADQLKRNPQARADSWSRSDATKAHDEIELHMKIEFEKIAKRDEANYRELERRIDSLEACRERIDESMKAFSDRLDYLIRFQELSHRNAHSREKS